MTPLLFFFLFFEGKCEGEWLNFFSVSEGERKERDHFLTFIFFFPRI